MQSTGIGFFPAKTRQGAKMSDFKWMPGMLDEHGNRYIGHVPGCGNPLWARPCTMGVGHRLVEQTECCDYKPDYDDPATVGCLLQQVLEIPGLQLMAIERVEYWLVSLYVVEEKRFVRFHGFTLGTALKAALDAAGGE